MATIVLEIAEGDPLGLTFAVLAGGEPHRDLDVPVRTDPSALAARQAPGRIDGELLGGIGLTDSLCVCAVGRPAGWGEEFAVTDEAGRQLMLVVGEVGGPDALTLFDKDTLQRMAGAPISSHSPDQVERSQGEEESHLVVGGAELFADGVVCDSIVAAVGAARSSGRESGDRAFAAGWCGGVRVGQRVVAANGRPVGSMAALAAEVDGHGGRVTTLTLRSGPCVLGSIDAAGLAARAEPRLRCGLRLLRVNGADVQGLSFAETMGRIKTARPLTLELQEPPVSASTDDPEVSEMDLERMKHAEAAQLEHVTNSMIAAKRNGHDYATWLQECMPADYAHEYVTKERRNERFHQMWDSVQGSDETKRRYTSETNAILDLGELSLESQPR